MNSTDQNSSSLGISLRMERTDSWVKGCASKARSKERRSPDGKRTEFRSRHGLASPIRWYFWWYAFNEESSDPLPSSNRENFSIPASAPQNIPVSSREVQKPATAKPSRVFLSWLSGYVPWISDGIGGYFCWYRPRKRTFPLRDTNMPHTDIQVRNARYNSDGTGNRLSDGGGMYLQLDKSGGKYWRMNYRFVGKKRSRSAPIRLCRWRGAHRRSQLV